MANRVLYQRLNKERRHQRESNIGRNLRLKSKLIAETNLLDRKIVFEERHLFNQRDLLLVLRFQRKPEQVAQVLDHAPRQLWITLHMRRNRVERIEQKMWIELHTQRIQPRLRKAVLQP